MFGPTILDAHTSKPVHEFSMHIDEAGDFYGDYKNYTMGDFRLEEDGNGAEMDISGESCTDSEHEGDGDVEEEINDVEINAMVAGEEVGLEPECAGSEQEARQIWKMGIHIPTRNQHFGYVVERKNHLRTDHLLFNFQEIQQVWCTHGGTLTKICSTLQPSVVRIVNLCCSHHKWSGR